MQSTTADRPSATIDSGLHPGCKVGGQAGRLCSALTGGHEDDVGGELLRGAALPGTRRSEGGAGSRAHSSAGSIGAQQQRTEAGCVPSFASQTRHSLPPAPRRHACGHARRGPWSRYSAELFFSQLLHQLAAPACTSKVDLGELDAQPSTQLVPPAATARAPRDRPTNLGGLDAQLDLVADDLGLGDLRQRGWMGMH